MTDSTQTSFDNSAVNSSIVDNSECMTGDELVARMKEALENQEHIMDASQEELFHYFKKLESGECKFAQLRTFI